MKCAIIIMCKCWMNPDGVPVNRDGIGQGGGHFFMYLTERKKQLTFIVTLILLMLRCVLLWKLVLCAV